MDGNTTYIKPNDPMIGTLVLGQYKLLEKLGSGSYGVVYKASFNDKFYAIKLELKKSEPNENLLEIEAKVMRYLYGPCLPFIKSYGSNNTHNILVMELMGKSLEDIFQNVGKKMSVRCVCNIGYQMIEIMEFIHNKHIIHRDIKPDNFVIGLNDKSKYIYIIDFGLCKKYRSSKTLEHYPKKENQGLVGTARYASIHSLEGLSKSRRDDLEEIGYVLMYLLKGRLPWQGIPVKTKKERQMKILESKKAITPEDLCYGFPGEFTKYFKHTRELDYKEEPKYDFLKKLFISVLKKENYEIDCYYDWDRQTIRYKRDFQNYPNSFNIKDIFSSQNNELETVALPPIFNNNNNTIIHHNLKNQNNTAPPGSNIFKINNMNDVQNNNNQNINLPNNNVNNNNITNNIKNDNIDMINDPSMNNIANKSALISMYNPKGSGIPEQPDINIISQNSKNDNQNQNNLTRSSSNLHVSYTDKKETPNEEINLKKDIINSINNDNNSEKKFEERKKNNKECCCIF